MKINLSTLSPWADIHRMWSNMRGIRIVDVKGQAYDGEAEIELSEEGVLTITLQHERIARRIVQESVPAG